MKISLLLLVLLALSTAPAFAATGATAGPPSAEELLATIFTPTGPAQPPAGAVWKATCTVSNDCGPFSPTVSCSSASGNCTSGASFVECDGVRTNCAPCKVSTRCSNGQVLSCTGTTINDCEREPGCFVGCSGHFFGPCPVCP